MMAEGEKRGSGEGEPKTALGRRAAKADAAAALIKEKKAAEPPETDIFTEYVLPSAAAIGTGIVTGGNIPLTMGAFSATQDIATGLKAQDWTKVGKGTLQAGLTYGGAKAAQGKDYSGMFEGGDWDKLYEQDPQAWSDEVDRYLKFEEMSRAVGK